MNRRRERMSQMRAMVSAMGIVLYFASTTVWLPSALLRSTLLTGVDRNLADLAALAVWGIGLGAGMWGLRKLQERELI